MVVMVRFFAYHRLYAHRQKSVKTMPTCQAKDFKITIDGTQSPYTVAAEYEGQTGHGQFQHDALQPDWAETLRVLAATQTPPGEPLILRIGGLLFDELIQGSIRDLWVQARNGLTIGEHLRVRLNLRPPAVAALPWETLVDPRRRRALAADKSFALVRTVTDVEFLDKPRPIDAQLPAKILVIAVEEPNSLDLAAEINHIQTSLSLLLPTHIELNILQGRVDLPALRRRLEEYRPDILHIISHGEMDGIYLWGNDGLSLVKASQWAALLGLVDSVKLVFLNACLAGQTDDSIQFVSLAQRLLQTGIPAVIAMQFEVLDRAAAEFAGFLYTALVTGPCPGAIDTAVSIARSGLYISNPDRIDYATPLLWLNSPNGLILQWANGAAQSSHVAPRAALAEPLPPPPPLVLDIGEKEQWFAQLPDTIAVPELHFDYAERKNVIEDALRGLRQDYDTQQAVQPLDTGRVNERLNIFNTERRILDKIIERVRRAAE